MFFFSYNQKKKMALLKIGGQIYSEVWKILKLGKTYWFKKNVCIMIRWNWIIVEYTINFTE